MLTKKQFALLGGSIVLLVLILVLPKVRTGAPKGPVNESSQVFSFTAYVDSVKKTLDPASTKLVEEQETFFRSSVTIDKKVAALDSLSKVYYAMKFPAAGAYYVSEIAYISNKTEDWIAAGSRLYSSSHFVQPEQGRKLISKAIECYQKALELDPSNLQAKTKMGICYVEGTDNPMQGITLLREVVAKDSLHREAQVNLALFAIQSGQFEKAIERLNKLLTFDPGFSEAYLYLGEAYASKGDKAKAIESLEKFKAQGKDPQINAQVDDYIKKLKETK